MCIIPSRRYFLGSAFLAGAFLIFFPALLAAPANATVLIFDADPQFNNGDLIPKDYGDRVTGSPQSSGSRLYYYGSAGGWTPNVVVEYGADHGKDNFWSTGYGDLTNVLENEYDNDNKIYITFTADPGYLVRLESFDLAGYPQTNREVYNITITAGSQTLYSIYNVIASGSTHTTLTPNVQAQQLVLTLDIRLGGDSYCVGIDNIKFSQVSIPPSLALLGSGLLGLVGRRWFRRG